MDYLPIFTKLDNRSCLVVGGGDVALRKVHLLLKAGAKVSICALKFHSELILKAHTQDVHIIHQAFSPYLLEKQWLVIAATNDHNVNEEVAKAAEERQIFVNVVDCPELSSFIMPAIVDRSPIIVAISSSGRAPVLARLIRERLEALLPMHIGNLASISGAFRQRVKDKIKKVSLRRRYWENLFSNGQLGSLLEQGKTDKVLELMESALTTQITCGDVALVGAGPGDPSLLTLKALQLMQQADIVLYDRLVSSEILDLVRRDAELISVGKQAGNHYIEQSRTNKMLIKYAQQGKKVVRLKGGDPFIFGRGGEELEELFEAGVSFQVVPGITAASGCSAYAGIPLTHRDFAQSVIFVTGHQKSKGEKLNWQALACPKQTLVVYMGLLQVEQIQNQLLLFGRDKNTPIALIHKGTTNQQHVLIGTLEELAQLGDGLQGSTLIIIGEVVSLAKKLSWFNPQNSSQLSRGASFLNFP